MISIIFLVGSLAFSASWSHAEILTREGVLSLLQQSGDRWKQSETLVQEAQAKTGLAWSLALPHLDIASRQYAMRVSSLKYGLPEFAQSGVVVAGSTNIEGTFALLDVTSWMRIGAAKLNENAASEQKFQIQNDLAFTALLQYATAQRQHRRWLASRDSLERSEELKRMASARVSSGVGVKLDVMRAEALLSADRLRALDAESTYYKALRDLAVLVGQERIDSELLPLEFSEIDPSFIQKLETQDPSLRPEVQFARLQHASTEQLARAANWDWLPKAHLFADLGYIGSGSILGFGNGVLNGTLALQISIPLYSGGLYSARLAQSRLQALRSELQTHQATIEGRAQNAYVLSQIRMARLAVQASRERHQAVDEEARLVKSRFDAGSASGLELTNSHASLAAAEDQEIDAIYSYETARLSVLRALGELGGVRE